MNVFYLILPIWGGLSAGASFRALMNLIRPMLQASWALSNLLLPALVQARANGHAEFRSRTLSALVPYTVGPALCWLVLGVFHQPLISLLYGGRYTEHSGLLWLLGFYPVLAGIQLVLGYSVRALERPDLLFLSYALPAVAALVLGAGLMYLWGLAGAAIGLLLSQAIADVMVVIYYRKLRRLSEMSERSGVTPEPGLLGGR